MKKSFSLVLATYGREKEVEEFLKSIKKTDYDKDKIEIIVVDQNEKGKINLEKIVKKYKEILNIKYIRSSKKGLSINRNIGIKEATGEIIAFPDDDCEYLDDTLNKVDYLFSNENYDVLMGRIIERNRSDSLRIWNKEESEVTKSNFYKKCSSITLFMKKEKAYIKFNELLGVGRYFGACEDADIVYQNCKRGKKILYTPEIQIYHPHYDSKANMPLDKIKSYGLGFGAMVKENFDLHMVILFIKAEGFHCLKSLIYLLKLKKDDSKKSYVAFTSRIKGFIEYKRDLDEK